MSTSIGNQNLSEPIIRKKMLTAKNEASCKTVINFGDFGQGVLDEPKEHGGSGKGPSPLHGLLGTLCGCESVTFHRAAKEMNFEYYCSEFLLVNKLYVNKKKKCKKKGCSKWKGGKCQCSLK